MMAAIHQDAETEVGIYKRKKSKKKNFKAFFSWSMSCRSRGRYRISYFFSLKLVFFLVILLFFKLDR